MGPKKNSGVVVFLQTQKLFFPPTKWYWAMSVFGLLGSTIIINLFWDTTLGSDVTNMMRLLLNERSSLL